MLFVKKITLQEKHSRLSSKSDCDIFIFIIIQNMKTQINSYWDQILKIKYFQKLQQTSTITTFYHQKFVFSWFYEKFIFKNQYPIISPEKYFLGSRCKENYRNPTILRNVTVFSVWEFLIIEMFRFYFLVRLIVYDHRAT